MWELLAGSRTAVLSQHGCYMLLPFAPRVYSLLVSTPCCICVLLGVTAQSFKTVKLLATPRLACLGSVSNRVIARKLERKRKIKRCKREGEGRKGSFFPLPLPRHSFFFCSRSRRTRAETLATQATPRLFIGATGQRVHPNEEENMATCFHGGQRIR